MNSKSEFNGRSTGNQTTNFGDGILPQDNFYQFRQNIQEESRSEPSDEEIKQILIARRKEQLNNNPEARGSGTRVSTKLAVAALAVLTFFGGLVAANSDKDFLNSEEARQKVIELNDVDKIVFHGNIRSNPEIPNSQDPNNILATLDESVTLDIPEGTKILYYENKSDPNGGWYCIPADVLADESFISKGKARKKIEKDGDSGVWVNHNNASVARYDTEATTSSDSVLE